MDELFAERKEGRFDVYDNISERAYNGVLAGVILYGLLANFLICAFGTEFALSINPIALIIGYIVLCFAGTMISAKSQNPIISFIGYNMVVLPIGLVVAVVVAAYGGVSASIVREAVYYTFLIVAIMFLASMAYPDFFAKLGRVLFGCLIGIIVVEVILLILGVSQTITSIIAAAVFSFYIGFDFWRAQQYPKTLDNAVDCALDIYLDIINLFLRILRILSRSRD